MRLMYKNIKDIRTLVSTLKQRELLIILLFKFYNALFSTVTILHFRGLFSSVTSVAFFEHFPQKNFISILDVSILIVLSNEMNEQSVFWIVYLKVGSENVQQQTFQKIQLNKKHKSGLDRKRGQNILWETLVINHKTNMRA